MSAATLLGLTGGIGSGKSTVAQMLAVQGAAIIDADAISRATTAAGGAALPTIAQQFGAHLIAPDGALDRTAMRALVFDDTDARQRLEAIIHPLVLQQVRQQAQAAIASGTRVIVYDIPLLTESGHWRQRLQQVVVVDCDTETQIARVMQRNQLERPAVEGIIASQATRAQRRQIADAVIRNGAGISLAGLQAQTRTLAQRFGLIIDAKGNPA